MSPFIAELLGTMVMILLGDGVVANVVLKKTKGFQAGWITITTAWALAVFTGVVIAGPYSGAHLNPAITIGFAIAEKFPWASVGPYIIAQMLGAALGAFLVWIIYYDHFKATEDTGAKLGVFCTAPEIRHNIVNFGCEPPSCLCSPSSILPGPNSCQTWIQPPRSGSVPSGPFPYRSLFGSSVFP